MQIAGVISRSGARYLAAASLLANQSLLSRTRLIVPPSPLQSTIGYAFRPAPGFERSYHDGRPRGPLWRGKKLIGKEALFAILGMKRFKDDGEKLDKFMKTHVLRLLKMDMVAVLTELERQGEVSLSVKVNFEFWLYLVLRWLYIVL